MSQNKLPALMFGAAAGIASGAAAIGLMLVALAAVLSFRADVASLMHQHPLFVSGFELIFSGFLTGVPLFALWHMRRPQ